MKQTHARPIPALDAATQARFWDAVDMTDPSGCWRWSGGLDPNGYGVFEHAGSTWRAHRIAWEIVNARRQPLERHYQLDHKCGRKSCVNPSHLQQLSVADHEAVTRRRGGRYAPLPKTPAKSETNWKAIALAAASGHRMEVARLREQEGFLSAGERTLKCPSCDGECTHHDITVVHERSEDAPTKTTVVGEAERVARPDECGPRRPITMPPNPSLRRHGVSICGWCELCEERWVLDLSQHKGTTYVHLRGMDESPA